MNNTIIKAENISKAYLTGQIKSKTFSRDFESWLARLSRKNDTYFSTDNIHLVNKNNKMFWALKNINFEIKEGDIIALTGKNGAGKSTLLKIISRITAPTTGKITGKGRITSMLEIGAGFHPELTGQENIYLNGAMLGMSRSDIKSKFSSIADFAEIHHHMQTPVKRYSSGMYMRLAFAVATHLKSEILIADEILAVGDYTFQQKCINRLKSINQQEGTTILLVSHNPLNINSICNRSINLINGEIPC